MHPSTRPSRTLARRALYALLALTLTSGAAFAQPIEVEFWHGFTGALGETLEGYVADFNESQDEYQVNPSYKGTYNDTMVAAIAAFRSGTAPHIVQMFEVGTATMMYSGGAIMPVHQLFADTGVPFDPERYIAAIRGYYSNADGQMMSMPFNSSTTVMWVNNDALIAAGLDPETTSLKYWHEVRDVAKQVVDSGAAPCGLSFAWPSWSQFENFSAMHNVPLSTEMNGMAGLGAELRINSDLHVAHITNLAEMIAEGSATYGGRGNAADALFPSGECAIVQASSGLLARVNREATFAWAAHFLPVHQAFAAEPQNSIIGGASLWVMQSPTRTVEEYRAVAEFFNFLAQPEVAEKWHLDTGYLPIVNGVYEKLEGEGYYADRPGLAIPYLQLTNQPPTENSRGLQLGNMPEIRDIIEEEIEMVFQGQKTARAALDSAVERGNVVLRNFERATTPVHPGVAATRKDPMQRRTIFRHKFLPYLLLAPQLAITVVFFFYPAGQAIYQSLLLEDPFGLRTTFVWFENYAHVLTSPLYLEATKVTLVFTVAVTLGAMLPALLLAVMADQVIRGATGYRTLIIWPYAIAPAVAAVLWLFIFHPNIGQIGQGLRALGIPWDYRINSDHALWLVIFISAWKQVSYNFLFFLAGLQSIPKGIVEAAAIDGASPARRFWTVVFPLLSPTTFFLLVVNIIYAFFDTFGVIHAITQGGPGRATTTLMYRLYRDGWVNLDLGGSSAQSVILMTAVILLTVIQFRYIERRVHY